MYTCTYKCASVHIYSSTDTCASLTYEHLHIHRHLFRHGYLPTHVYCHTNFYPPTHIHTYTHETEGEELVEPGFGLGKAHVFSSFYLSSKVSLQSLITLCLASSTMTPWPPGSTMTLCLSRSTIVRAYQWSTTNSVRFSMALPSSLDQVFGFKS